MESNSLISTGSDSNSTAFTESNIPLLPIRRPSFSEKVRGTKETFVSNLFPVNLNKKFSHVYQYDVKFQPQVENDSRSIKKGLIMNSKSAIEKNIGKFILSNDMLWGTKETSQKLDFKCIFQRQGTKFQHILVLTRVKVIEIEKCQEAILLQILNALLKQSLAGCGMVELGGRGKYFDINQVHKNQIMDTSYKFWRGFFASIHFIKGELFLCVDMKTRILSRDTVYMGSNNSRYPYEIRNKTVQASYGQHEVYTIIKLSDKTPESTFEHKQKKMTFIQYYKQKYGIIIQDKRQKLLLSTVENRTKDGKRETHDVYLVPELMHFTGVDQRDKNNPNLVKETRVEPTRRLQHARGFKQKIPVNDLFQIQKQFHTVRGRVMDPPQVVAAGSKRISLRKEDGRMSYRDCQPLKNLKISKWILAYTKTDERDQSIVDAFLKYFRTSAKTFSIEIPEPIFYIIHDGKQNTYLDRLDEDFKKHGKEGIMFAVTLLKPREQDFYHGLKKLLISKYGVPHQVVMTKHFQKEKSVLSVCSNILLQIAAKVGCPLWQVKTDVPQLQNKKILIGGMALFHKLITKTESCCAFVGNLDNDQTEFFSKAKLVPTNQQRFDSIKTIFEEWVKTYCKQNKATPDYIIIYREGVGDGYLKTILETEVSLINQTIQLIKRKMKKEDYNPGVAFVVASRKNNIKFFERERSKSRQRSKGHEQVSNPTPRSVVGQDLSQDRFDFNMSPHFVNQGSCTPTHFNVIYNTTNLKEDDFYNITIEQCHNYYNWQGPVRIPAALQYANKLATLLGDSLKQEPNASLSNLLYYL